jgi:hypothetical protein
LRKQDVTFHRLYLSKYAVGSRTDLSGRFSPRAPITKEEPLGPLGVDLDAAAALILTVVQLKQVRFNLGKPSKTSQFASPNRALQPAGQSFCKSKPSQPVPEAASVALAALGQR